VRQLLEHPTLLELDPADTRIPDARAALSVGRAAQRLDSGAESVTDENEKRAREGAQSRSQEG
jgi:hypothetical protein